MWLRVVPDKALCDFSPQNVTYNPNGRSIANENFTGYCGSVNQIEGHIRTPAGDPVQGVAVLLREESNLWNTTVFRADSAYLAGDTDSVESGPGEKLSNIGQFTTQGDAGS